MTTTKSRVAVIGAGSAGLAVVQQLRSIEGDRTFKKLTGSIRDCCV